MGVNYNEGFYAYLSKGNHIKKSECQQDKRIWERIAFFDTL